MEIIELDINLLKPYELNAKTHDKKQIKNVAESIKQFGWQQPIVIDKNYVIIIGHCRYESAKLLKLKKVPCVIAENLDDEKVKKLRLIDNKTNESDWDFDLLQKDMFNLDFSGFDIDWGIDEFDIEQKVAEEDGFDVDSAIPEEPKSKLGDIYQLGNHRLMCGDSTNKDDVEKLMNGNKADMVFTDPPYGISIVGKYGKVGSANLAKAGIYMPIKGDETTDTTKYFYEVCKNLGIEKFILFGGNYFTDFLPFSDGWIIWDKRGDMASNNFADGEMAWCSFHTPVRIYKQLWNGMIKEGESGKRVHPTQKPVRLIGDILKDFSKENDIIFDAFGGSGSTLIACEKLDRICYMMEFEPHYVDVIINRWENFTGKKAVLLERK